VCLGTTVEESLVQLRDRGDQIDCLVTEDALLEHWLPSLAEAGVLLPVVAVTPAGATPGHGAAHLPWKDIYHGAVVTLPSNYLDQLESSIRQAIQQFLALPADACALPVAPESTAETAEATETTAETEAAVPTPELLSAQQDRLTDKLKARLGYLGVYYKRNPEYFLRNMSQVDRETLLNQLKIDYRKIVLGYFSNDAKLNQNIDAFVDQAFMADISVSLIVEMHMDLMDEFSKQLKLEGRSEEILLDYRLTLIDVIAHLCEMYRRSIPREP
jgi:circadian clock protein KaiA